MSLAVSSLKLRPTMEKECGDAEDVDAIATNELTAATGVCMLYRVSAVESEYE